MRPGKPVLAYLLASILANLGPSLGAELGPPPDGRVRVSTEATTDENQASLEVYSAKKYFEVYIDGDYAGKTPYSGSLSPGSHYIEARKYGYYPLGTWVAAQAKTRYTIRFTPALISGTIILSVQPQGASVTLDGNPVSPGYIEVPVGTHRIVASGFGFVEQELEAIVHENGAVVVDIRLDKAPFSIKGFGFARPRFNPANAGAPGRSSLDFKATSYGSAHADIRGPDGSLVASLDYPEFRSWNQSLTWDGLGPDGKSLPDGLYTATLVAKPAPGVPVQAEGPLLGGGTVGSEGEILREAEATIDSSLVVRAFGSAAAVPGLLLMPDPLPQPAGTVSTEFLWIAPWARPQDSAFGISGAVSAGGRATISLFAAAETSDGPETKLELGASALLALFGSRAESFRGAFFLRGCYGSSSAPVLPGAASGLEASLPLALRLANSGGLELCLAASPGALLDLSSSEAALSALARAGLWLEGKSFRAGLSGRLPIGISGSGASPDWPASLALEGRLMLGPTPLVVSLCASAELEPGLRPSYGAGLGLGLLF